MVVKPLPMEWYIVLILSAFSSIVAWFVGQRMQPKNKILADTNRYYEEVINGLKTDMRRVRGQLTYYKKGAIPDSIVNGNSAPDIVDAVIGSLPPNFKTMIGPFRNQIVEYAKENPELVNTAVAALQARMSKGGGGEEQNASNDYL